MTSPENTPAVVSPSALNQQLADVLLLDVRTPGEYSAEHIDGSVLMPLDELDLPQVEALATGKRACVVICQSGKRALRAAERLHVASLPALGILEGGVNAWSAAGLPLIRGKGVISIERQVRIAAGAFVLTGALLGYFVNTHWIALSGFVGAGLIFAGITDTCGMGLLLAKMPWNRRCGCCCGSSCNLSNS